MIPLTLGRMPEAVSLDIGLDTAEDGLVERVRAVASGEETRAERNGEPRSPFGSME